MTSDARLVLAPDIPAFAEMGLPALSIRTGRVFSRPCIGARIGQRQTIEARLLLSTVILSDSKRKLVARIGWSKCGERNAKKPDAFRDRELGFEQIQADPLQCGSFFDYPGQ